MKHHITNKISSNRLLTRRDILIQGAAGLVTLVGFGSHLAGRVFAET